MQTFKMSATSNISMDAAMANAMARASLNANSAVKIEIIPVGMIESDGAFTVQVVVKVIEESDLTPEELENIKGERALHESHEFEHGEMTHEFDEEATGITVSVAHIEGIEQVIPTPILDHINAGENLTLTIREVDVPEMEPLSAPEWNNADEIIRDKKKKDFKNDNKPAEELPPKLVEN